MHGVSRLVEELLASQEGLCSKELVSELVKGREVPEPIQI